MGAAELGWRHTLPAFEGLGKILCITEPTIFRDLLNIHGGIQQKLCGHLVSFRIQQFLEAGVLFSEPATQGAR